MEVYLVMYDWRDNYDSPCLGVFGTKISAEMEIERHMAEWGQNKDEFNRNNDFWSGNGEDADTRYWIETHQVMGLTVTKPAVRK